MSFSRLTTASIDITSKVTDPKEVIEGDAQARSQQADRFGHG